MKHVYSHDFFALLPMNLVFSMNLAVCYLPKLTCKIQMLKCVNAVTSGLILNLLSVPFLKRNCVNNHQFTSNNINLMTYLLTNLNTPLIVTSFAANLHIGTITSWLPIPTTAITPPCLVACIIQSIYKQFCPKWLCVYSAT